MTNDARRKALIITFAWPPAEGVGVTRALKFAKYLPSYGWESIVLTAAGGAESSGAGGQAVEGVRVVRTGYRDILEDFKVRIGLKRSAVVGPDASPAAAAKVDCACGRRKKRPSLVRELLLMPDDQRGWYPLALDAARSLLRRERVDVIISTSPPETAHLIARRLKREFGIPWVADLRDLWADDHFRPRLAIKRSILRLMERRVLGDADRVVTVSEPWAAILRRSLGKGTEEVAVIENGFDDEDFRGLPGPAAGGRLTIAYTGKLHEDAQPVAALFRVLKGLIAEGRIDRRMIAVDFYILGYDRPDITSLAQTYGIADVVSERGKVSYGESLRVQRAAHLLLFVQWRGRNGDGWYSAKLYDYLGARRPILALGCRGGIVDDLITGTASGVVAETDAELRDALTRFYDEYRLTGAVLSRADEVRVVQHTRRVSAGGLAALCAALAAKR